MYEKGNVSIREEKKIPRMFHSRSHFDFFSLTAHQKQVKYTALQLAKKKEQFLPRSATVVKWVLDNIRIFIL